MGLCPPHTCQQPMCHPGTPHPPALLWPLAQHGSQAGGAQLSARKTWEQLKESASCQNKGLNHCRAGKNLPQRPASGCCPLGVGARAAAPWALGLKGLWLCCPCPRTRGCDGELPARCKHQASALHPLGVCTSWEEDEACRWCGCGCSSVLLALCQLCKTQPGRACAPVHRSALSRSSSLTRCFCPFPAAGLPCLTVPALPVPQSPGTPFPATHSHLEQSFFGNTELDPQ